MPYKDPAAKKAHDAEYRRKNIDQIKAFERLRHTATYKPKRPRHSDTCSVEGCAKPFHCKGYCKRHYERLRITGSLDLKPVVIVIRICSIEGCGRPHFGHGWCAMHHTRMRIHGTTDDPTPHVPKAPTPCLVEGCEGTMTKNVKGYCSMHYSRWLKTGDPGPATMKRYPKADNCLVHGCVRSVVTNGFCAMHNARVQKFGDPGPVDSTRLSDNVTYETAHKRVRKARGPARDQTCPCGNPAMHWAYDNSDPDVRYSPKGRVYSLDIYHYTALCAPCHSKLDEPQRLAGQEAAKLRVVKRRTHWTQGSLFSV